MLGGGPQRLGQMLLVGVDRAGGEGGAGTERQGQRVEGQILRAERRRLRDLPLLRGGRVLALGEPVDLVVEQQDLDRHVAAESVDQMVAADREPVAVAGDNPHRQVGAGRGDAGRDRRCAPVDRVDAVGVDVVDEAPRAADAAHENAPFGGNAELGQQRLDGGEDRVVAAARAPARLLVGSEVLFRQRPRDHLAGALVRVAVPAAVAVAVRSPVAAHAALRARSTRSSICSTMSAVNIGRPVTFEKLSTSTRYSARNNRASWPRFSSGTSTRR
ncbi:hypothetical protein HRbin41_01259 [bacterium HR41]|nr:hypothetical protein HRbin41_01259 [bacterium HR41]